MNAADQFEAFKRLADNQTEACLGVSAHVERQRMRLGG